MEQADFSNQNVREQYRKQYNEFIKYVSHSDIMTLVENINNNDTNFVGIKQLLTDCLSKQFAGLPIQHDELKQNVFKTFCLMVNNAETGFILYGGIWSFMKLDGTLERSGNFNRITPLKTIAKIAVNEWMKDIYTQTTRLETTEISENKNNAGKPEPKPFINYLLHENKTALMSELHKLLDGKKGKPVRVAIETLKLCGMIGGYKYMNELYESMRIEFGKIGTNSGLNQFEIKGMKTDINVMAETLKKV